jgi:hypothetical protein
LRAILRPLPKATAVAVAVVAIAIAIKTVELSRPPFVPLVWHAADVDGQWQ